MFRQRAVLDSVRDAILLADFDTGMIVDANHAAEILTGRSLKELRTLHHTQLHPPERKNAARRGFKKDTELPGLTDASILHKDGRRISVEVASSHYTQPNGRRILVGVFRDTTERNAAREALRRSEERFEQVAASAGRFIWEVDANGLYLYASPAVEQIVGYTPEEVVGKLHFYDLFVPESREETKAAAFEIFARKEAFGAFLNWNVRKDGRVVALETNGVPVLDANGTLFGYRGADTDVTERKQAEAALRESEERFRNMADSAPAMIWVSGPDKLCTFFNKAWLAFTGRPMEEELGNGWASGVHPEDVDGCFAIFSSSFDARQSFRMEYRLRRADGEYRWILDNGTPRYQKGEFAGFIGSCIDITEQKEVEERLRANEVRLKEAQRLAKVGSWEYDLKTDSMDWSDEILRIFGMTEAAPNFAEFLDYIHPEDRESFSEASARIRSGPGPVEMAHRIILPDGQVRFLHAVAEGIRDGGGVPVRIVGAAQDITEDVEARERLRESEERLKRAERIAQVGNWQWDLWADRVMWSEEIFRMFGKPAEYAPSYNGFMEAILPEDKDRVAAWIGRCVAEKRGSSHEFRIVRPEGSVRTLACIAEVSLAADGLPSRIFGACQDITARKEVEELLRESESTTRALLETAAQAILAVDGEGTIVLANRMAGEMFGYGPGELLGRQLELLVPQRFRALHRSHREEFDSNAGVRSIGPADNLVGLRKDGSEFPIEVNLSRVPTSRGPLTVSFVSDITERNKAEAALRHSEQQLRALAGSLLTAQEDERRRLSRDLHDDITQRLALLSIELGNLAADIPPSRTETHGKVRGLRDQTMQLSNEVRRISRGLHPSVIEDFGLSIALEEFCHEFSLAKGVQVEFEGFVEDSQLDLAGATNLYRVAQESLRNAVTHGHSTEIRVGLTLESGFIHLYVKDNGSGFSVENGRPHRGLGLISMQERIRLMHGTLKIVSKRGQGTEVTASVPLTGAEA